MSKIALITGATSGIGRATAQVFAEQGLDLIVCGRRTDRLAHLAAELRDLVRVLPLAFDVRDQTAVHAQLSTLPPQWQAVDILVNNAGNAHGLAPIHQGNLADWEAMIDINVKGLLYVSREVTPGMVARQRGHIVNLGSIAGQEAYPNGNVYCASKFAVDALTKTMRMDLYPHNVKVSAINPGLVETEFSLVRFKGDEARAAGVYQGMAPLTARDVAEVIYFMVSRPAHVNLADVLLLPTAQASATLVKREV
jgi:NADP-dependent 3-hydroxy acid dehydrogenase YdfG